MSVIDRPPGGAPPGPRVGAGGRAGGCVRSARASAVHPGGGLGGGGDVGVAGLGGGGAGGLEAGRRPAERPLAGVVGELEWPRRVITATRVAIPSKPSAHELALCVPALADAAGRARDHRQCLVSD